MNNDLKPSSKEYLNKVYSGPWKEGYADAYKRLDKEIASLDFYKKHLDVGCADGYFTKEYLAKYPDSIGWGIDISYRVIEEIKHSNFIVGDAYKLPFEEEFDLVHCGELLEHLEHPLRAILEMKRVLKTGGILIVSTPYKENPLYEEHLWSWGEEDIKELVKLELVNFDAKFFGNTMRLVFKK